MRLSPSRKMDDLPCSMVTIGCATENINPEIPEGLKKDGYLSLDAMNRYIRKNLNVRKKEYFKRGIRPILKDLLNHNKEKAVICVEGHYIYADGENYYSFLENDNDSIVCIWWLI